MSVFERSQKSILTARMSEDPRFITIVSGPRQTGKTTLVLQVIGQIQSDIVCQYESVDQPASPTLSLDPSLDLPQSNARTTELVHEERDARWLVGVWEQARRLARQSHRGAVLVLDEIQKIPNWSATIKGLWDADRRIELPLRVVLLGSAPLLMQQGLTESMAGRFETISLTHWSFEEMRNAFGFDIDQFIYFGGYPGAAQFVSDEERWSSFMSAALIEPNIERDILSLQRIDKPALLKNLFEMAASYSGQIMSFNKMLGQLYDAGNTTTLARYLDLLSKAGLVTGIPNFSKASYRKRASSPKLIVRNTALMTARSRYSFEQAMADRSYWGRLVETAVGAHLLNTAAHRQNVYYWRRGNEEVDFVLEDQDKLLAIEVKSGSRPTRTRGLTRFRELYGDSRSIVVGENGDESIRNFLSKPASEWIRDS